MATTYAGLYFHIHSHSVSLFVHPPPFFSRSKYWRKIFYHAALNFSMCYLLSEKNRTVLQPVPCEGANGYSSQEQFLCMILLLKGFKQKVTQIYQSLGKCSFNYKVQFPQVAHQDRKTNGVFHSVCFLNLALKAVSFGGTLLAPSPWPWNVTLG